MENTALAIVRKLFKEPLYANRIEDEIRDLPSTMRDNFLRRLMALPDLSVKDIAVGGDRENPFISADFILKNDWPEPQWIIPGVIPTGFTLVGGAPKLGKSWFALQIAQAVAAGGYTFGKKIEKGNVLYLALEDPARRLKDRMVRQKWEIGMPCDFLTVGKYQETIGDLRNGGGEKLNNYITGRDYKLIVIDTLSRAISGDQNDAMEMTNWLTPVQEIAHETNCCIMLLDHHNKIGSSDAVRDVLGSTAKGAMADTIVGLYRERGKPDARLTVTGREVEEQTLNLRFDRETGAWQLDNNPLAGLTAEQSDLILALEGIEPATTRQIAEALGKQWPENKGSVWNRLVSLEEKHRIYKIDDKWAISKPGGTDGRS